MEITNFIEREQVEKLREKIEEFMDVLEYEVSLYCLLDQKYKVIECINFLTDVDNNLHKKLNEFNKKIKNDRVSKR